MIREKKILLNYLLKQYKQSLKQSSDDELENDIKEYFRLQKQYQTKRALIQQKLDELEALNKSLKDKFEKIQNYMEENNISQKKVKNWVARLVVVIKYKRVSADYKQIWGEALKKVNKATRRVLQQIKIANEQAKRAATKIELQLVEENILDIVKSLYTKFAGLFKALNDYKRVSNSLPKLDIK